MGEVPVQGLRRADLEEGEGAQDDEVALGQVLVALLEVLRRPPDGVRGVLPRVRVCAARGQMGESGCVKKGPARGEVEARNRTERRVIVSSKWRRIGKRVASHLLHVSALDPALELRPQGHRADQLVRVVTVLTVARERRRRIKRRHEPELHMGTKGKITV